MRKLISIALVLMLCIIPMVVNATVKVNPASFVLHLAANPTTGYDWVIEFEKEGIVVVGSNEYTVSNMSIDIVGSPGEYAIEFAGVAPGNCAVTLTYLRSWEPDSAVVRITYFLNVSDTLDVTCAGSDFAFGPNVSE